MRATIKLRRLAVALTLPLGVLLGGGDAAGQGMMTGCLASNGKLSDLQMGETPAKPCKGNSVAVQLSMYGAEEEPTGSGETPADSPVQPFFVTLDHGTEATISINGPLEYFARCDTTGLLDRIDIYATSTQDGWWQEDGFSPLTANAEVREYSATGPAGSARYNNDVSEGSVIAADGSYLAIEGDTLGLGLNVFGHDCVVAGMVYTIAGSQ